MPIPFFIKRIYQLLDLCFTAFIFGSYRAFVFFFEDLKIAFRQFYSYQLLDLICFRLAIFLL